MKPLYTSLNEGILDIDFDVEEEVVYAVNVKDVILGLIEKYRNNENIDDIEKTCVDITSLLEDINKEQRADKTSIMKKLRMKDNTSMWMIKMPYKDNPYKLIIHRFVENPRPEEMSIFFYKRDDGSGYVSIHWPRHANHPSSISPNIAKTVAFMSTSVWDDIKRALDGR